MGYETNMKQKIHLIFVLFSFIGLLIGCGSERYTESDIDDDERIKMIQSLEPINDDDFIVLFSNIYEYYKHQLDSFHGYNVTYNHQYKSDNEIDDIRNSVMVDLSHFTDSICQQFDTLIVMEHSVESIGYNANYQTIGIKLAEQNYQVEIPYYDYPFERFFAGVYRKKLIRLDGYLERVIDTIYTAGEGSINYRTGMRDKPYDKSKMIFRISHASFDLSRMLAEKWRIEFRKGKVKTLLHLSKDRRGWFINDNNHEKKYTGEIYLSKLSILAQMWIDGSDTLISTKKMR